PNNPEIEAAVLRGESSFEKIGCAGCHVPALPLDKEGWVFSEPNPYNPPMNLRMGQARTLRVDLNDGLLPQPRLTLSGPTAAVWVPAYTDFKLHDISDPEDK